MAAVAHGDPHVYLGVAPPTIVMYDAAGVTLGVAYVNPELSEADITVNFDSSDHPNVSGEISHRRSKGEYLECNFQLIPKDSGATPTTADALKAATLPGSGFSFIVSGMKVIVAGSFADAFNCTVSTSPWFVQPGASLRGPAQEMATLTITARRYKGILSNTPVTE